MGRHQDCLSSSGIHDTAIRRRATKITDRSWEPRILLSTAGSILNGGRVYTIPTPKHWYGIDVFGPLVQEWWCEDRQLPVGKVANRAITGVPHEENTGWINHPFFQKGLAHMRESICLDVAWTWRWTGTSLMSFRLQNLRRRIVRQVSLNGLVPPSLMMYDTTTALSHIRHTTRDLCWGRDTATLRSTASIFNRLMCWLVCCLNNVPCSLWEPSCGWMHL